MTVDDVADNSPTYANMKMLGFTDLGGSISRSAEELYLEVHGNMQSQYREPPPYPGHSKQLNTPGLRQSFSGSETSTDVSVSSSENLATSQRQEPQGEETQVQTPYQQYDMNTSSDPGYSILARLGMSTSGMDLKPPNSPSLYVPAHGPHYATGPTQGFSSSPLSSAKQLQIDNQMTQNISKEGEFQGQTTVSSYNASTLYANVPWTQFGGMDSQSQAGQILPPYYPGLTTTLPTSLPPPPQYPGAQYNLDFSDRTEVRRSYETVLKTELPGSRSQPDLSHLFDSQNKPVGSFLYAGSDQGSQQSIEHSVEGRVDLDHIATQATRMVEMLSEENKGLREKLFLCDKKVSKLQKFELEIQKVHEAYESQVKSFQKFEKLELMRKKRLEEEIKKLQSQNKELREQLETVGIHDSSQGSGEAVDSGKEPSGLAAILQRNKELQFLTESQEEELEAQQKTIQEQKAQIDLLRNVQTSLQEQCRRQAEQVQTEYLALKTAYGRKEEMEKQLRMKLEKEVETLRSNKLSPGSAKSRDVNADMTSVMSLKRMLDEKEANILQLEKELIQWKEQHLEESIRKLKLQEMDSASEQRLPVYDQPTKDTERLINEAKTEKLKQMEEVYNANRKVAELEAQVKSLQSQLSEKEALVRVFQRSPMTRSSSVHTLYRSPLHSPRPSLIATGSLSRQSSQSEASTLREFKHMKTGSTSALETGSHSFQDDDLFEKIQSLHTQNKSDGEEEASEKTVWQV